MTDAAEAAANEVVAKNAVVAKEVAEAEFERFLDAMDLVPERHDLRGDDLDEFQDAKARILLAIRRGHLVIDEEGQPVYTPQVGEREPITFYEPTGATYTAKPAMAGRGGKRKTPDEMDRMHAMLADMTRQPIVRFKKMKGRDVKVCHAIWSIFFAG